MVFSSNVFLFIFLPIVLIVYYLIGVRAKNYWLLLASLIFYAWNQPRFLWIILYCIIINYFGGVAISKCEQQRSRILWTGITVFLNLACLFYFKYFNLAIDIFEKVFSKKLSFAEVILPIGISFFTFQSMSYIFDVYRDKVPVQKNILKLALYIVLFPQLVAGPIVRYADVALEIEERKMKFEDLVTGMKRFVIGLFKKVVIANAMASTADAIWSIAPNENTVATAWLGIIAYTLQIYFDFSGYSDMAIGLGRMFGFHFNENFNLPYISKSISEFWRRWHISLSSWFRDYVYIPLGGNRKHVYLNLAIVFLLTGIWHGANYTFIFWGIWHGTFILIERFLKNRNEGVLSVNKWGRGLGHIYTLLIVMVGWVFFRADSISQGLLYCRSMFGLIPDIKPGFEVNWYLDHYTVTVLVIAIMWSTPFLEKVKRAIVRKIGGNVSCVLENAGLLLMFGYSIIRVVSSTYNPFIYFQF